MAATQFKCLSRLMPGDGQRVTSLVKTFFKRKTRSRPTFGAKNPTDSLRDGTDPARAVPLAPIGGSSPPRAGISE